MNLSTREEERKYYFSTIVLDELKKKVCKFMKKNKKVVIVITIFILIGIAIVFGITSLVQYIRIKTAKIEVTLAEDLTINFADKKKVSDFIVSINGTILDDYEIDTTTLGTKNISFRFKNDDNIKVSYSYNVEIVDKTSPVIWLSGSYTITKGQDVDIAKKVLCGDNVDNHPNCYIEGEYDYNKKGVYPLVFKAEDASGNITEQKFNLNVLEPKKNSSSSTTTPTYTAFADAITNYKTEKTKIGIDVSSWQGEIDFDAIQKAGVEFIIIRVGGTRGRNGEYFVDNYFVRNITEANKRNIDVGIYFYSYANSLEKAKEEAEWVIDQIKDYKVTLPIAYDWENWSTFNEYNLSFFGLTNMAETFLDTVKEAGYDGLLYSSKNFLERLWFPTKYDTWLAHYTSNTSYKGTYKYWQMCSDGKIDGIKGPVDIDIMYLD